MAGRFRTLRDLELMEGGTAASSGKIPPMTVHHMPDLSDADACKRMLRQIHREFYPIMERRAYRVLTLSEMCCCGDGLDYDSGNVDENVSPNQHTDDTAASVAARRPKKKRKRRRRKLRKMGLNVLGYNRTHSNGTHDIHLRLRDARRHSQLLSYEEVAGTMAHELAHCEHGPHNAAFYKLMDEILEQHATFMARGIVADDHGFPMNSNQAYTLGGGPSAISGRNPKNAAALAAQSRQERSRFMPQGPQKLGGDSHFRSLLGPGQAAGMAAEMRRLKDDQWCQPCTPDDIIELSSDEENDSVSGDDHDEVEDKPDAKEGDKKPAAVERDAEKSSPAAINNCIDLTNDSDGDDDDEVKSEQITSTSTASIDNAMSSVSHDGTKAASKSDERTEWSCERCTFVNAPMALACGACGTEVRSLQETLGVVDAIVRTDSVQLVKETEVERAEQEFGFNIYGCNSEKTATRTMKHIT